MSTKKHVPAPVPTPVPAPVPDAKEIEEINHHTRNKPSVAAFIAFSSAIRPTAVQEKEEVWARSHVGLPRWLIPYFIARQSTCTRYNHQAGRGCTKGAECAFLHTCVLCGAGGHGVFFRARDKTFTCPVHAALEAELAELNEELGCEDAADRVNTAIERMRQHVAPPAVVRVRRNAHK